jgi:hypothetical protein
MWSPFSLVVADAAEASLAAMIIESGATVNDSTTVITTTTTTAAALRKPRPELVLRGPLIDGKHPREVGVFEL